MSSDLVDRLRLVRSPGIGPVTYRQLIARFGSAAAALDAIPDLAARGGGKPPRMTSVADAERGRLGRSVQALEELRQLDQSD